MSRDPEKGRPFQALGNLNRWWAAGMAAALAYGWWAVGLPPFSAIATVAIVGAGALAMVLGVRRRPCQPGARPAGTGWWAVLAVAAGWWQLMAYLQEPRSDHPTLSSLTNALLDTRLLRAVAFALWALAAAGLARR